MSRATKRTYRKILRNRKRRIERRLKPKVYEDQPRPMFAASNIHYEMAGKTQGISCGGIGAFHQLAQRIGLTREIDQNLHLLSKHVPYHESDHVLNITYNALLGGVRLEDIELRRNDEVFLEALGADRIPDPTTSGDFTRRFGPEDIVKLMEAVNRCRGRVWDEQPKNFLKEAILDIDGTLARTYGECKEGMDISYKGIWGYAPLIVSLANTKEVLYLVNRPGNLPSHTGAAEWIDRAIELLWSRSKSICLRGDTDFSLTAEFDRWAEQVDFVFGMDAHPKLVSLAEQLPRKAWKRLNRRAKYEVKTRARRKPQRTKEKIVKERGFENIRLASEEVAEFTYRPVKCKRSYRMVVVRKNLSVEKGEDVLFDDIRYFFYVSTREDLSASELVRFANQRCDQENVIEQLKNGVNAMRMPVDNLQSNWAYMVMTALAWNLKAWFGLLMPDAQHGETVVRMEFRRFLHAFVWLPAQIIRGGRKVVYRLLGYNAWIKDFFETYERIICLSY
jgi:hypothetical protein